VSLLLSIGIMVAVVVPLVAWAVRRDRRRLAEQRPAVKEEVM
jgi:hypothetical protein